MTHGQTTAKALCTLAAEGLREGWLTLKDVVGLSERELAALVRAAETLQQRGELSQALRVYGCLAMVAPYEGRYWRAMADLQQRMGNHPEAVLCFEAAALVSDRTPAASRAEAVSLERLGDPVTARTLRATARRTPRGSGPPRFPRNPAG